MDTYISWILTASESPDVLEESMSHRKIYQQAIWSLEIISRSWISVAKLSKFRNLPGQDGVFVTFASRFVCVRWIKFVVSERARENWANEKRNSRKKIFYKLCKKNVHVSSWLSNSRSVMATTTRAQLEKSLNFRFVKLIPRRFIVQMRISSKGCWKVHWHHFRWRTASNKRKKPTHMSTRDTIRFETPPIFSRSSV